MRKIVEQTEIFMTNGSVGGNQTTKLDVPNDATARAIATICESMEINKLIAVTRSGFAARTLSAIGVKVPIIAVSDVSANSKSFNLLAGVTGVAYPKEFSTTDVSHVSGVLEYLWQNKFILDDEQILVTALAYPTSGKRMNSIETHLVGDLAKSLNWRG